jgi:hypothetical protein
MRLSILLAMLLVVPFAHTAAQDTPSQRTGGWFGVGFAYGQLSGRGVSDVNNHTAAVHVRTGGTLSSHFRLGGELDLGGGAGMLSAALALSGYAYPVANADFFLKAGIAARHLNEGIADYPDAVTDLAGVVGLGYDWRLGGRFSITPFAQIALALAVLTTNEYAEGTDWNLTQWHVGVSFTWH